MKKLLSVLTVLSLAIIPVQGIVIEFAPSSASVEEGHLRVGESRQWDDPEWPNFGSACWYTGAAHWEDDGGLRIDATFKEWDYRQIGLTMYNLDSVETYNIQIVCEIIEPPSTHSIEYWHLQVTGQTNTVLYNWFDLYNMGAISTDADGCSVISLTNQSRDGVIEFALVSSHGAGLFIDSVIITTVPEPSTLMFIMGAVLLLIFVGYIRRTKNNS